MDTLTAMPNLRYATNILVRIQYTEIHLLARLSHLRSLCIEILDIHWCIGEVIRLLDMRNKTDDQLWVIKMRNRNTIYTVCIHNGLYLHTENILLPLPEGFAYASLYRVYPRKFGRLLSALLPYLDDELKKPVEIILGWRYLPWSIMYTSNILAAIADYIGPRRFKSLAEEYMCEDLGVGAAAGVALSVHRWDIPWRLLHLYDIPSHPQIITDAERAVLDKYHDNNMA